jgi:epoxide hydrolase-like predicted phosphatase
MIEAVISDFGGVLTSPLLDSFTAFGEQSGISPDDLGAALGAIWSRNGTNPLAELETGRMTEAAFLGALSDELSARFGRQVRMEGFGERFFEHLEPNQRMLEYMRELRRRGYRLAICTNNIREWEARWRAMLPVDEIFDVVVDSAFVGTRKPEPQIYELTLERLSVAPQAALLIDDVELNCQGAREVGIHSVWFQSSEQAIADTEALLAASADKADASAA